MAELTAQRSVNTRDLPELALIKNGNAVNGGFSADSVLFTFGTTEILLISAANGATGDFTDNGTTLTGGHVRAVEVSIGGAPGYTITGLEFPVISLLADASDNGKLDTLPAEMFDGNEVLNGSSFADVLYAYGSDDILNGNDGDDTLNGGANHDELTGGLGADKLTGGADSDAFIFLALSDSTRKKAGRDTILDFEKGDIIDLSAIDAKKGKSNQDFKFIKKQDFHEKKGELRYKVKKDDVLLQGDTNGDGKADFAVLVADMKKLTGSDFEL
jgi:Ca2+-binding RTX toxin-like protein